MTKYTRFKQALERAEQRNKKASTENNLHHKNNDYEKDLESWIEKLEKEDKYGMTKEQVIEQAKKLNASFDNYTEEDLYVMYLANESDYEKYITDPTMFIKLAIGFLEDKDVSKIGTEKVKSYLYNIVM